MRTYGAPTRTARHRVYTRAAALWKAGKPHEAWRQFDQADMTDHWPAFLRVALRLARREYIRSMP